MSENSTSPDDDPLKIDWCDRARRLRRVEEAMLMGDMVTEARFGEDMARYANTSLAAVQIALKEALRECQKSRGIKPVVTRYAKSGRMTRAY